MKTLMPFLAVVLLSGCASAPKTSSVSDAETIEYQRHENADQANTIQKLQDKNAQLQINNELAQHKLQAQLNDELAAHKQDVERLQQANTQLQISNATAPNNNEKLNNELVSDGNAIKDQAVQIVDQKQAIQQPQNEKAQLQAQVNYEVEQHKKDTGVEQDNIQIQTGNTTAPMSDSNAVGSSQIGATQIAPLPSENTSDSNSATTLPTPEQLMNSIKSSENMSDSNSTMASTPEPPVGDSNQQPPDTSDNFWQDVKKIGILVGTGSTILEFWQQIKPLFLDDTGN